MLAHVKHIVKPLLVHKGHQVSTIVDLNGFLSELLKLSTSDNTLKVTICPLEKSLNCHNLTVGNPFNYSSVGELVSSLLDTYTPLWFALTNDKSTYYFVTADVEVTVDKPRERFSRLRFSVKQ